MNKNKNKEIIKENITKKYYAAKKLNNNKIIDYSDKIIDDSDKIIDDSDKIIDDNDNDNKLLDDSDKDNKIIDDSDNDNDFYYISIIINFLMCFNKYKAKIK